MRPIALGLLGLLTLESGCGEPTGPGSAFPTYALARVGNSPLPISLSGDQPYPRLLGDTLVLNTTSTTAPSFTADRITVIEQPPHQIQRAVVRFAASRDGGVLVVESCPLGAFCIASLVYAPITYAVIGDSLNQLLPAGSTQKPYVYGRVQAH